MSEKINIVVCDDEATAQKIVTKNLYKLFEDNNISVDIHPTSSIKEVLENLCHYRIFFLDIDMPEMSGIDLATAIKEKNPEALIVFVSGKNQYVFLSFCAHPFSFVRKSHFAEDIRMTVKDLVKELQKKEEENHLLLTDELGHTHKILPPTIHYIEADDKYVRLIMEGNTCMIRTTMKACEQLLKDVHFVRCHKSYIINLEKVYAIKKDYAIMLDKTEIPLRRGLSTKLKEQLHDYLLTL